MHTVTCENMKKPKLNKNNAEVVIKTINLALNILN